ncbi:MAG TPA: dipeptidase PepE [Burkholderiales bacterium]|nr:dipeptidase PepE [Burkholderiales bacterium]
MDLLLLSNSRTPGGYLTDYLPAIRELAGDAPRAAFIPFAGVTISWEEYHARVQAALPFKVESYEHVDEADLVIVGGGNTFHLLHHVRKRGLLEMIRKRVLSGEAKYLGWSAGANLACPTIKTTNDMPVIDPGGLEALGLVRFQINPHYTNAIPPGHQGETRDQRLEEFVRVNPDLPVIGLPEGDYLRIAKSSARLLGPHPAMWFTAGRAPQPLQPGHLP